MDQIQDDLLLRQINGVRSRMEDVKKSSAKLRVIGISTTANQSNPDVYVSSFRESDTLAYVSFVFRSVRFLPEIIEKLDGVADYFALDVETKNELTDLSPRAKALIKKSAIHYVRPNEMTIEGVDMLSQVCLPDIGNASIAICGIGRIGMSLAHRFRQYHAGSLCLVTRDVAVTAARLEKTHHADLCPLLISYEDFYKQTPKINLAILCASASGVMGKNMVEGLADHGVVMDVGGGGLRDEALVLLQQRGIAALSFTVTPQILSYFHALQEYRALSARRSSRSVGSHILVSLGHLGKRGDVLVDDAENPQKIYGICDGCGRISPSELTLEEIKP